MRLKKMIMKDRVEYVSDIRSLYEDNAPKDTGDLAGSCEQYDTLEESVLAVMQSYAPFIEHGTEPFKAKLIEIDLGPRIRQRIEKAGGKVVTTNTWQWKQLAIPEKRDGVTHNYMKEQVTRVLVPVWWDWARRKVHITDPAERYKFCWAVWYKIAKKGITAQWPMTRAIATAKGKEHLYKLTLRTKAEFRRT